MALHSKSFGIGMAIGNEADVEPASNLSRTDQLEYLADLTLELKEIADNLGCATLAGVLVVAYREAIIQAQRR